MARLPRVPLNGRVEAVSDDVGEHRWREQPVDGLEVAVLELGALYKDKKRNSELVSPMLIDE